MDIIKCSRPAGSPFLIVLLLVLSAFQMGCAAPVSAPESKPEPEPVPVTEVAPPSAKAENGLILLPVTIRNDLAPDYQPQALFVRLRKMNSPDDHPLLRFNVLPADKAGTGGRQNGNTYLLRLQLQAGTYRLLGINISAGDFPVRGFGFMPIHADFTVPDSGNLYLGHVTGVNRQRSPDEYRTGPVTPQADQSVTGMSEGTFDVSVRDLFEQDLSRYRTRFPAIGNHQIDKFLLPNIDRQRAQQYWQQP